MIETIIFICSHNIFFFTKIVIKIVIKYKEIV